MATETIGRNSTDTYTGCEDTQIRQGAPTTNSGSGTQLEVTKYAVGDHNHTLIKFSGLSNLAGVTVSAATLYFRVESGGGLPNTASARALLRAWVESEATWNNYSTGNAWTTGGGLSDGNDRSSSVSGSVSVTGASAYFGIDVTADVQAIVAGGNNYGWHLERTDGQDDTDYIVVNSSEDSDGRRPYLEVTYTAGPAPLPRVFPFRRVA